MKLEDFLAEFPDQNDLLDSDSRDFEVVAEIDNKLYTVNKIETDWTNDKTIIHLTAKN